MSILIKGVEMPKAGEMLCIDIYPDGKVCVNLDLDCKQIATAVPVPPHGRLIDADSLKEDAKCQYASRIISYESFLEINAMLDCNAPTIIPASKEGE